MPYDKRISMTIATAKARKLISEGIEDTKTLCELSSLGERRILDIKYEVAQEIADNANTSLLSSLNTTAEKTIIKQRKQVTERLLSVTEQLSSMTTLDKGYNQWLVSESKLREELRKLTGGEILLKVAEKQAINSVDVENSKPSSGKTNEDYDRLMGLIPDS